MEIRLFERPDICLAKIQDDLKIEKFLWTTNNFKLLTVTSQHLKISIYDLQTSEVGVLSEIKMVKKAFDISSDGKFIAVLQIAPSGKECIEVFNVRGSFSVNAFQIESKNSTHIKFGHINQFILVFEQFFSNTLSIYSINGELIDRIESSSPIYSLKQSQSRRYLALSRTNGSLMLHNGIVFTEIFEISLRIIFENLKTATIYEEIQNFDHFNLDFLDKGRKSEVTSLWQPSEAASEILIWKF